MSFSPAALVLLTSFVLLASGEPFTASVAPALSTRVARVAACDAPVLALPDSIEIGRDLQQIVRSWLEHSPSFRQQCRALAAAPHVRATVRIAYRPWGTESRRAMTTFRQNRDGDIDADIEIRNALNLTELLAHELEHVLEQVEGVDLEALAGSQRARRLADGAFETARAIQVGRRVAAEVVNNAPDRVLDAGASIWRTLRRAVGADSHVAPAARNSP